MKTDNPRERERGTAQPQAATTTLSIFFIFVCRTRVAGSSYTNILEREITKRNIQPLLHETTTFGGGFSPPAYQPSRTQGSALGGVDRTAYPLPPPALPGLSFVGLCHTRRPQMTCEC